MSLTEIKSTPASISSYLRQLYVGRHLIYVFAKRELRSRYARSYLGVLWALFQPLLILGVFSVFFGKLLGVETTCPYPVFVFTGLVFWFNFSAIAQGTGRALIDGQPFVSKFAFPHTTLLLAKVLSALFEFALSLIFLIVLMLWYGLPLGSAFLLLPVLLLLNAIVALGVGFWVSALTVKYRDLHHMIPHIISFGVFVTPVFFPATLVPDNWSFLVYLNPLAGISEWARWSVCGSALPQPAMLWGLLPALLLFVSGFLYFVKTDEHLSDEL